MTLFPDPPADPAPPPLSEADVAAGVLEYLDGEYPDVLAWLRRRLVGIYRFRVAADGRDNAYVTADDGRRILPRCPYPVPECKNFCGAIFKAKGWRAVGFHKSETPGSHGNRLMRWVFDGDLSEAGPLGRGPEGTAPKAAQGEQP